MGLDLHDCPRATTQNALLPGTVLTIEPGLYIPRQGLGCPFPIEYQGIGVRIEDDIIVGQDRPEVITSDVPVEVSDLEDIIGTQTYKKFN